VTKKTKTVQHQAGSVRRPDASASLNPPASTRQVAFYQLLVAARKKWFLDALSEALGQIEPRTVKAQIVEFVPTEAQKALAVAGLRDEHVFPLPAVLEAKPSLVGYYRLLLGASQKAFYEGATHMSAFKSMEEMGTINEKQATKLSDFCRAMAVPMAEMVCQISTLTERDLRELPLLTFGAQLQGFNNTQIGKKAMQDVFATITAIVKRHIVRTEPTRLTLKNSSGRIVYINRAHDPDVSIYEEMGNQLHSKVAIEVKGGTDVSNAHNRAGEAEKSHLKAKEKGFRDFWTIISKHGLDLAKLKQESQTTTEWFDVTTLLARRGDDWEAFRERLAGAVGIPIDN